MTTLSVLTEAARNIDDLRQRISGEIILPGDEPYEEARQLHDFQHQRFPSVIVRAAESEDVAEAVRFARRHHLPFTVRSGGHSIPGYSVMDGTVVIDLSHFKRVVIDPQTQTARVQPGATSADLAIPANAHGLALSTGDASSVGLGGLVTGGGIGWFVRKYGLAADRLRSAQMVTADGEILRVSDMEHPDLFWAIRGGGGNFGIITEFEFQLVPVQYVYGGAVVLPPTRDVLRNYLEYALHAPDELTTISAIMPAPPAPFIPGDRVGEPVLLILVAWAGDAESGEKAVAPLRALGPVIADTVETIPYPVMFEYMAAAAAPHGAAVRSMFTRELPDDILDEMCAAIAQPSSPVSMVQIRPLGGQLARFEKDATAFAHRDTNYMVAVLGLWLDPEDDAAKHHAWADALWSQINRVREGVYSNFLSNEGEARVREAYPEETYQRLAAIKAQYDPENVFRFNQNIRPAAMGERRAA